MSQAQETLSRYAKVLLPQAQDVQNARWPENKETFGAWSLMFFHKGKFHEAVKVRTFIGRSRDAQTVLACVWFHDREGKRWLSGKGSAGGYGYCKQSGAIDAAVTSAGIKVGENGRGFHGAGMSSAKEALREIARALGWHGKIPCEWVGHD